MGTRRCRGRVKGPCLNTAARGTRGGERICAASPSCGSSWRWPDLRRLLSFRSRSDTDLVCLTNRRNRSYYRNEIGLPCSAAPISGDDQLIRLLYQERAMGLIARRTKADTLFCPRCLAPVSPTLPTVVILHDMNFRDIPATMLQDVRLLYHLSRVVTVSQYALDDMRRCRRENCDDSRGGSLRDQRAP